MKAVREAKSLRKILSTACAAVLATAAGASAATQTWSGAGPDDKWTTSANWLSSTAPVANDSLVFDNALLFNATNDFAADTAFSGIAFGAGAGQYTLGGNQITLHGDLTDDAAGIPQTINFGLALDASRGIRVTDAGSLVLNGVISGTDVGLTKTGNGNLTFGASNTYTGATTLEGGTVTYTADNLNAKAINFGITPT